MRKNALKKVSLTGRRDAREAAAAGARRASLLLAALLPLVSAAAGLLPAQSLAADALPKLGADLTQSSVSGLSSGAFMAAQIQVAHASDIVGAGIVAGGPYACAESAASQAFPFWPTAVAQNAAQALYKCMKTDWGEPDPLALVKRTKELAEAGAIDPIADLKDDNVYLFSGNDDQTVMRPVVRAAAAFYKEIGVDPGNIALIE
jgi:poly(3-hydroxybutyrate) depolymerase